MRFTLFLGLCLSVAKAEVTAPTAFKRGDPNVDGTADLSDAIYTLGFLFLCEPPALGCQEAADTNDDGVLELTDAIALLSFLFQEGPPPADPFGHCGTDPTPDGVGCTSFPPCPPGPPSCDAVLGIVTISASTNDGNVPANAVDGTFSTRWSGDGIGAYITADLGLAQTMCGVSLAWYQGNSRQNYFVVSTSSDGASFQRIYSGTSSGTTTGFETYTFPQGSARYLRVTVNGNTVNNWASITELRVTGPGGNYNQAILADNPVAFWNFTPASASESDLSGNGNTGTYGGGLPPAATMPNGDFAADFNGSTQYMQVPSNKSMSIQTTHSLTWEAWIKPTTLQFPNHLDGYVDFMGKCEIYSPTCEWEARMYNTTNLENRCNRISAYVFNPSAGKGSGADWQPTCGLLVAGHWYHVVGEYTTLSQPAACNGPQPGSIDIWVNGVKWDQSKHGQTGCMSQYHITPVANDSSFRIGTVSADSWFQGAIGKVAIYDHLLSQSQITAHYQRMTGQSPNGSCSDTCTLANP